MYSKENLLFVSEVEKFKKKTEIFKDKKSKADEIFTKYLNQNAPSETRLVCIYYKTQFLNLKRTVITLKSIIDKVSIEKNRIFLYFKLKLWYD